MDFIPVEDAVFLTLVTRLVRENGRFPFVAKDKDEQGELNKYNERIHELVFDGKMVTRAFRRSEPLCPLVVSACREMLQAASGNG